MATSANGKISIVLKRKSLPEFDKNNDIGGELPSGENNRRMAEIIATTSRKCVDLPFHSTTCPPSTSPSSSSGSARSKTPNSSSSSRSSSPKRKKREEEDDQLPAAFALKNDSGGESGKESEAERSDHEAEMVKKSRQIRNRERWELLKYKLMVPSSSNEHRRGETVEEWNEEREREFVFSLL